MAPGEPPRKPWGAPASYGRGAKKPPAVGALVAPGASLGRLRVLGRTRELRVPDAVTGRVVEAPEVARLAVAYGARLLEVEAGYLNHQVH